MTELTLQSIEQEIVIAEGKLETDERALRLWLRMRIEPQQWSQKQYLDVEPFWVIAILGTRCLYFNTVESGWGWGRYATQGHISEYHWQQDEIYHLVFQTLFTIDHGNSG